MRLLPLKLLSDISRNWVSQCEDMARCCPGDSPRVMTFVTVDNRTTETNKSCNFHSCIYTSCLLNVSPLAWMLRRFSCCCEDAWPEQSPAAFFTCERQSRGGGGNVWTIGSEHFHASKRLKSHRNHIWFCCPSLISCCSRRKGFFWSGWKQDVPRKTLLCPTRASLMT